MFNTLSRFVCSDVQFLALLFPSAELKKAGTRSIVSSHVLNFLEDWSYFGFIVGISGSQTHLDSEIQVRTCWVSATEVSQKKPFGKHN